MSASAYARGGTLYNSLEAKYGTTAAERGWKDAIAAEKAGVNVDGAWRANEDYMLAGKSTGQVDGSFWSNLGTQLYDAPLAAPLEQAGKILGNTADTAGNAAKSVLKKITGNWGTIAILAVLAVAAFLYFGGSGFIRRRVSKIP